MAWLLLLSILSLSLSELLWHSLSSIPSNMLLVYFNCQAHRPDNSKAHVLIHFGTDFLFYSEFEFCNFLWPFQGKYGPGHECRKQGESHRTEKAALNDVGILFWAGWPLIVEYTIYIRGLSQLNQLVAQCLRSFPYILCCYTHWG